MFVPGIIASRLNERFKTWAEDKRGVAAIEFAMIAIPFFLLIFGMLEVCMLFIMSSILEHGVGEAARAVRTGQMQAAGATGDDFRNAICDELFDMLYDCKNRLKIDVRTFDNFSSTAAPNVITPSGELDDTGFGYSPGTRDSIVVVRAFYEWDLFVPGLTKPLANLSDGRRLLQGTAAFRNEPFNSATAAPET